MGIQSGFAKSNEIQVGAWMRNLRLIGFPLKGHEKAAKLAATGTGWMREGEGIYIDTHIYVHTYIHT